MKAQMTLAEAAAETAFGPEHLRRCITSTKPTPDRPALKARRDGKGRYLIRAQDLQAWIDAHPDA